MCIISYLVNPAKSDSRYSLKMWVHGHKQLYAGHFVDVIYTHLTLIYMNLYLVNQVVNTEIKIILNLFIFVNSTVIICMTIFGGGGKMSVLANAALIHSSSVGAMSSLWVKKEQCFVYGVSLSST